ncbi:cytochrome c3 family protein [Thermodesulfobacteriota bacterium]
MKKYFTFFSLSIFFVISFFAIIVSCSQNETTKDTGEKSTKEEISVAPKTAPEDKSLTSKKPKMEAAGAKEVPGTVPETVEYPSELVLLSSLWKTHSKGPVKLTHRKHVKNYGVSCKECHHVFQKNKNIWQPGMPVNKCETCHNDSTIKGEAGLPPGSRIRNLKSAFHKNCQTCHRKLKHQNSDTNAPTACGGCHQKKEK